MRCGSSRWHGEIITSLFLPHGNRTNGSCGKAKKKLHSVHSLFCPLHNRWFDCSNICPPLLWNQHNACVVVRLVFSLCIGHHRPRRLILVIREVVSHCCGCCTLAPSKNTNNAPTHTLPRKRKERKGESCDSTTTTKRSPTCYSRTAAERRRMVQIVSVCGEGGWGRAPPKGERSIHWKTQWNI